MFGKIIDRWYNLPVTIKASTAYTVSNILQRSLSLITLPLFTRLLTTEQYGQATLYSSWGGVFAIVLTMQLAWGSFGTAMVKFETKRDEYISSVQGIFLLLSVVFFALYFPFRQTWNAIFQLPTFFVVLLVVESIMQNSILLWSGKKRYEFKYKSVIVLTLATSVMAPFIAYVCVILSEEKGWARVFGNALVVIVSGFVIFILNWVRGKKLFNKEFWKYAFGFNVPLIPYYLSQMIFNQSDRIMISHYSGTADAALYGVAYNLAMILSFVIGAINNSYVPWLYEKMKDGKQWENRLVSSVLSLVIAFLILPVIWLAPEVIYVMAGEKYETAVYVVPPVAMSLLLLFYTGLSTDILFYYEEKWQLVGTSIGAAILNIVLNAIFIPKFGFIVAGYTTFASYVVFATSNFFAVYYVLKKRNIRESGLNIKWLTLIICVFTFLGWLGLFLYEYRKVRLVIAFGGIFIMLSQYKRVLVFIRGLKSKK